MSSLYQEKLLNILTHFSPKRTLSHFYPCGDLSSNKHSQETEENASNDEIKNDFSIDEKKIVNDSVRIISFEEASPDSSSSAKCFSSSFSANGMDYELKISELNEIIKTLHEKCKNYEKQNEDLRKEIKIASQSMCENMKTDMKKELQNCKAKVKFHENMMIKVMAPAEELCDEEPELSRKSLNFDMHNYNYLISKLEIVRLRMSRFTAKIQQLEYEKSSISDMLNCYITTDKIIDIQKSKSNSSDNTVNDCLNFVLSRRSSALLEANTNAYVNRQFDEENYFKRPSSSASETLESNENMQIRNTFTNLKGISCLGRVSGNCIHPKEKKNEKSLSISPFIPKPKKNCKSANCKENYRVNTIKANKFEEQKKKLSCKKY